VLSPLFVLSRVNGVSKIAEESGLSRKGVQKALSDNGNPALSNINSILHPMGYLLSPQKMNV
jgi:DNA-binding phage protein